MTRRMDSEREESSWSGSLAGIGLTPNQEAVYRAVLVRPTLGVADLPQVSGIGEDAAASAVRALVSRGLLEDAEGELIAVSPVLALGDVVTGAERQARLARAALDELADQYRAVRQERAVGGLEVVRGRSNIANWINHLLRSTEVQMRMFAKPPFAVVGISETDAEKEFASRRMRERVIIERALLDESEAEEKLLASLDRGQEIRLVETLPSKLLIVDDAQAIVPLDDGGESHDAVVAIGPGGLLASLIRLFEAEWERSTQLREAPGRRLDPYPARIDDLDDPMDRKVLALLLAGHTDAAVAARLGIGLRTVQRRIRHLMDLASTDSRVLLGWYARDRGWL
jgi:sugar-specific transcriptional regulator TrmB